MTHIFDIRKDNHVESVILSHGLAAYVGEYGWHFTKELFEWATAMFELAKPILPEGLNISLTWDELFTANMAKSDFYPSVLKDDKACIAYAKALSDDKDAYDGMILKRWITDCEGRGVIINWDLFI